MAPLWWESTDGQWVPPTNGQWRLKASRTCCVFYFVCNWEEIDHVTTVVTVTDNLTIGTPAKDAPMVAREPQDAANPPASWRTKVGNNSDM